METRTLPLKISGIIFLVIALFHLLRVIFKVEVIVNGSVVPIWISAGGCLFTLALSLWIFKSLKKF